MSDKTPQDVLREAAEILQRDGWHQGSFYKEPLSGGVNADLEASREAPVCSLGAINRAVYGYAYDGKSHVGYQALDAAKSNLTYWAEKLLMAQIDGHPVPHWNDAPERTVEDVILTFKRAAEG